MPDPALLTPLAKQMLGELPPFLRADPDHQAIAYAYAKEIERCEANVSIMREQAVASEATVLLKLWEIMVGAEVEPSVSQTERQTVVTAFLRALMADPTGLHWEAVVGLLAGSGWFYLDHVKGKGGTPPANVVRVFLPFATGSFWFGTLKRLIERVTPAHIALEVDAAEGFLLDVSELDKDEL